MGHRAGYVVSIWRMTIPLQSSELAMNAHTVWQLQKATGRIRAVLPEGVWPGRMRDGRIDKRDRNIKNHGQKFTLRLVKQLARLSRVTLLCHCAENQTRCHRHVLRKLLLSSRV